MARIFLTLAAVCIAVGAAPPGHQHGYPQHAQAQINTLDYYLENPESAQYYEQPQQKRGNGNINHENAPSRLESLEPDSEVELIPGAQLPQQPPQQTPVAPNIPGLLPGQRVFIVHMPVPGYRPGTIGGYQPVYIVAAAAQGNAGFPTNGYQNAVYLDPSGQVVSPTIYSRPVSGVQPNPGLQLGSPLIPNQYFGYQQPIVAYQTAPVLQGSDENKGIVRLAQVVGFQGPPVNKDKTTSATNEQKLSQTSNAKETEQRSPAQ
ncbi:uncharacterized protein LOC114250496 [Bombyx mandarina]|uniref:Uncharacterized protein LOC114250496 n=1 Tax=Bombyx mandarina TaxID=7092 RepID=A0A6J2KGY8_BOMMA|nr:uncharacterized protein LOC114250496 [Bombyx mandarina]